MGQVSGSTAAVSSRYGRREVIKFRFNLEVNKKVLLCDWSLRRLEC